MPRKQIETDAGSIRERIEWLLSKLWSGSQSRMAEELGVSQGAISNVVSGRRAAGRELLAAIARHPLVNPGWLITGEGTALRNESGASSATDFLLPSSPQLLPGPTQANRHLLTGERCATNRSSYHPSRYWFGVPTDSPWVTDTELKIASGDRLLIETDPAFWQGLKRKWGRLPCAVCVEGKPGAVPAFLVHQSARSRPIPRLYSQVSSSNNEEESIRYPDGGRLLRPIVLDRSRAPESSSDTPDKRQAAEAAPKVEIVGVCVELVRSL